MYIGPHNSACGTRLSERIPLAGLRQSLSYGWTVLCAAGVPDLLARRTFRRLTVGNPEAQKNTSLRGGLCALGVRKH